MGEVLYLRYISTMEVKMSRPKIQEMCTCSFMCSGFITNTSSYRGIFNRTNLSYQGS